MPPVMYRGAATNGDYILLRRVVLAYSRPILAARAKLMTRKLLASSKLRVLSSCTFLRLGANDEDGVEDCGADRSLRGAVVGGAEPHRTRAPAEDAGPVAEGECGDGSGDGLVVHRSGRHGRGADADVVSDSTLGYDVLRGDERAALPGLVLSCRSGISTREKLE